MSPHLRGILTLIAGLLALTMMDGVNKYLVGQFSVFQVLFLRNALVAPFAAATAAKLSVRKIRLPRPVWLHLLRTSIITVEMVLVVKAFGLMELADAHAILAATPLIVLALAGPLLGEVIGARRWLAVGMGLVGVMVVLRPGLTIVEPGALLVLVSTVLYALYQILTRMVMQSEGVATTYSFQSVVSAGMLAGPALYFWQAPDAVSWTLVACVALLGGAGHLCVIRAFQLAPAALLQPYNYWQIVFAMLVGWVAFGDLPDIWTTVGAAIIVIAGVYAVWQEPDLRRRSD